MSVKKLVESKLFEDEAVDKSKFSEGNLVLAPGIGLCKITRIYEVFGETRAEAIEPDGMKAVISLNGAKLTNKEEIIDWLNQ